jgi:hypothetical protein
MGAGRWSDIGRCFPSRNSVNLIRKYAPFVPGRRCLATIEIAHFHVAVGSKFPGEIHNDHVRDHTCIDNKFINVSNFEQITNGISIKLSAYVFRFAVARPNVLASALPGLHLAGQLRLPCVFPAEN